MKASDFISCPDHLLAAAIAYGEWLEGRGYSVAIEPFELEYPNTPLFKAKRNKETLFVEIMDAPDWDRIGEWAKYGRACHTETRFLVGLAKDRALSVEEMGKMSSLGVGAVVLGSSAPIESVGTKDLALNLEAPALPTALRPKLGHAYDQIDHGDWREGFEESCLVLEQEARTYLKKHVGKRIQILSKGGQVANPTSAQIGKLTLGALAELFGRIRSPNQTDSRIGEALKRVNEDRVSVVHYKNASVRREANARKRFGKNMMIVVNALKLLGGLK